MIKGFTFQAQRFTSQDWAHVINNFYNKQSGITKGCEMTHTDTDITIQDGRFITYGRLSGVIGNEVIEVEPTLSGELFARLVYEVDLSKTNTVEEFNQGSFKVLVNASAYPVLTKEDLDAGGTIYQMLFAEFKIGTLGITDFFDKRTYLDITTAQAQLSRQIEDLINNIDVDNLPAALVKITDSGDYYDGVNVEGALQEVGSQLADIRYLENTGTANALEVEKAGFTLTDGNYFEVKTLADNTDVVTANVSNLGVKSCRNEKGEEFTSGKLKSGYHKFIYDSVNDFFVQAPSGGDLDNLLPENIKVGVTVNDVVGTLLPADTMIEGDNVIYSNSLSTTSWDWVSSPIATIKVSGTVKLNYTCWASGQADLEVYRNNVKIKNHCVTGNLNESLILSVAVGETFNIKLRSYSGNPSNASIIFKTAQKKYIE